VREQLASVSAEAKTLTTDKHSLESSVHELRIKLQSAETQVAELGNALKTTRSENAKLDANAHDTTKSIHSSNVRMATLEQSLHDKDELLEKTMALLESANGAKGQLEDTVMLLKQTVDKYDQKVKASIDEIHKGNGYIEQLSSELQAAKGKVKLKATIIRQQEQLLQEKEHTSSSHSKEMSSMRAELTRCQSDAERMCAHHLSLLCERVRM
jgi:chromosome segregation ATPase